MDRFIDRWIDILKDRDRQTDRQMNFLDLKLGISGVTAAGKHLQ